MLTEHRSVVNSRNSSFLDSSILALFISRLQMSMARLQMSMARTLFPNPFSTRSAYGGDLNREYLNNGNI